ncbi:MAG: hypothetical protein KGI70_00060 [Patescibacteria group bacterium]|nr:hypothetical protein [Patescibacteria group bacterium]
MDTEIQSLKKEVDELKSLTLDTNRTVHKMRRAAWWGRLWGIVWWLLIFGASGAAYYYYVQPYVNTIMKEYGNAKDLQLQVQNWFAQFGHTTSQ